MSEAHRRLLDMLAGWAEFKVNESSFSMLNPKNNPTTKEEQEQYNLEEAVLLDIYQDAGNITANDPEYDENEPNPERVKSFVLEKVLPFILNGAQK